MFARLFFAASTALFVFAAAAHAAVPPPQVNPLRANASANANAPALGLAPQATANLQREFTLEGFFAGETVGRGTILSKTIGASRTFNVSTTGTWDGSVLTLVETYQYSFGSGEQRVWRFTKNADGTYMADSDEIEEPVEVQIKDREASLRYKKKVPRPDKKPLKLTFVEKWTLQENGVLQSQTTLRRFVRVGRERINFVRVGNEAALTAPGF